MRAERKRGAKPSSGKAAREAGGPVAKARPRRPVQGRRGDRRAAAAARPAARRSPRPRRSAAKATPAAKPRSAPKPGPPQGERSRRTPSPRAKAPRPGAKTGSRGAAEPRAAAPALSEEDQIRSAKYLPRDLPPRLFEEERFLFPESYGVNRVRLLVKDPDWLFAHWDVDPKALDAMKKAMGERAMALSRLTLRVVDPGNGGSSDILLPPRALGAGTSGPTRPGASYKAELGVTLPSGEFRRLAESNVVVTPRVGPSRERAQRRITFGQAGRLPQGSGDSRSGRAELESAATGAGPWRAPSIDGACAARPRAARAGERLRSGRPPRRAALGSRRRERCLPARRGQRRAPALRPAPGQSREVPKMPAGYWCPVLHAHLPYVRHPEYPEFLEEDWFFEALSETYVPLVRVLDGLLQDGVDYRLTMTLSPPLLSMMQDDLLVGRYHRYLDRLVDLSHREVERTQARDRRFADVARFYAHEFTDIRRIFRETYGSDIVRAFRKHRDAGKLEIITCGATHGFLPLMETVPQAVRAQIQVAVQPLPQGPRPRPLGDLAPGVRLLPRGRGVPARGRHPLRLPRVPRPDRRPPAPALRRPRAPGHARAAWCSSAATWSRRARCGAPSRATPGDYDYREFYKDVGWELPMDYLADFLPDGARKNLGLKYYRVTGKVGLGDKQPYVRAWALEKAASHAGNFLGNRQKQIEHLAGTHRPAAGGGEPLRRGALRPLVVRGARLPELPLPQDALRPGRREAR